jgi:hypothetical protein
VNSIQFLELLNLVRIEMFESEEKPLALGNGGEVCTSSRFELIRSKTQ